MFVIHINPIVFENLLLIIKVFQQNLQIVPSQKRLICIQQTDNSKNSTLKQLIKENLSKFFKHINCHLFTENSQTHKLKKTKEVRTIMVFGYLIFITIDFYDCNSPFSRQFQQRLRKYIKHSRLCLFSFLNTSSWLKVCQKYSHISSRFVEMGSNKVFQV